MFRKKILYSLIFLSFLVGFSLEAQSLSHVVISFSPRTGSFVQGSTFQVPILLDTKGKSINGIEIRISFDRNKLAIIDPSSGVSIIGVWLNPPVYDNTRGTASYVGVVPNGITTDSGLIGMITFQAKATGAAVISIESGSKILLNDGAGTPTTVDTVRAEYNILPKAPEGVTVYSATHPVEDNWYNNNSPVLSWQRDLGVSGFSYEVDNKPNTIPDNTADSDETTTSFESLSDGLWYFHIKANKAGVWGTTGHFLLRIDTVPPAKFKPQVNFLIAAIISSERSLVSFFTTDNLSGIDHYEVGIIDKMQPATQSPIFVQAESPFQVPLNAGGKLEVIVRAMDKAGNARDASIDVRLHSTIVNFFYDYPVYILLGIIILGFIVSILHFLIGHHIIRYIRRVRQLLKKEKIEEEKKIEEVEKTLPPTDGTTPQY